MSKEIYFTSDTHYGHFNVIKYCDRPFTSTEEMDEKMILLHNELVKPGDTVYHLGDFSMRPNLVTSVLPRLNGVIHLIAGNHDKCHPAEHKNKPQKIENAKEIYKGFASISLHNELRVLTEDKSYFFRMSHMPYKNLEPGPHGETHTQYRLNDDGSWLLHGHVHQHWKTKGRMINVGVDVWDFRPVHIDQILEIVDNYKEETK